MEELIQSLESDDVKLKLSSAEKLLEQLRASPTVTSAQKETRNRLIAACTDLLNESNSKIVLAGLESLGLLVDHNSDMFRQHANPIFDALITRFTDNKVSSTSD
jgi:hypothetical protein